MIAASMQDLATDKLPFNWFDLLLLGLLILGLFRGRKHGMTQEILPLSKWLSVVLVAGLFYPVAALLFTNAFQTGKTASFIYGYLLLAFVIIGLFIVLKKLFVHRMEGKCFFGGSEYYLGMLAGIARFFCLSVTVLALLNAPYYSQSDIEAHEAYTKRWYGGGVYSGSYFPTLNTIQEQVFKRSLTGPYLKAGLSPILIETVPAGAERPKEKPVAGNVRK